MKDSVKEFEDLNNRIEKLFEGLGWLNPGNWFKDKPQSGQPNRNYTSGPALNKYLSNIENKKSDLGQYNNRFSSDPGSTDAYFYDRNGEITGYVKNMNPFLESAGITKATLRTYDLKKDPMKIKWLFDGNFEADFLGWDKKNKKVIFQGEWKNGLFGGIEYTTPKKTGTTTKKPTPKGVSIKPALKIPTPKLRKKP